MKCYQAITIHIIRNRIFVFEFAFSANPAKGYSTNRKLVLTFIIQNLAFLCKTCILIGKNQVTLEVVFYLCL